MWSSGWKADSGKAREYMRMSLEEVMLPELILSADSGDGEGKPGGG